MQVAVWFCIVYLVNSRHSLSWAEEDPPDDKERMYWGIHKKLAKQLTANYSAGRRPVKDESETVQVYIYANINHINNINESQGTITVHGYTHQTWVDEFLQWSADEGVKSIKVRRNQVWTPNLRFLNSAMGSSSMSAMNPFEPVKISNRGNAKIDPVFTLKAQCNMDITNYPYDQHVCPIIFSAGNYPIDKVNIETYSSDPGLNLNLYDWDKPIQDKTKVYVSGWQVLKVTESIIYQYRSMANGIQSSSVPPDPPQPYTYKLYQMHIHLRRYAPYFGVTVVLPCVLCSLVTVASFLLQPYELCVQTLVANVTIQALFLADLMVKLPVAVGGTPRIVTFYSFNMLTTIIAMIAHLALHNLEERVGDMNEKIIEIAKLRHMLPNNSDLNDSLWKDLALVLKLIISIAICFSYMICIFVLIA